ncbi:LuxR family transcriptional regulator [Defluviimonas sp. WL0002]|uniref:LuxR family transcriptional regulator n=1 Tax=Albidovulum marisflavi TaxID=2984159 RepID=A0ABT2ZFT9_9RHOB|nr:LuxR family transcriptional regulator [Defluviimonas sp. WL0002]MCV2869982.1 LuxR family transcriptional regulator [Defluviimonas sp. WL0002]
MVQFIEHATTILNARTIDETWATLVKSMSNFGVDGLLYGITRARTANSLGLEDEFLVLSNHPKDYLDAFVHSGLFVHGPMVQWALANEGVASWRLIGERVQAGGLSEAEAKVLELNRRYGLLAGYSISFRDASIKTKGAIGLCARHRDQDHMDGIWSKHGQKIEFLCRLAHLKLNALPFKSPRQPLTPRQREVLEWVGDGKSIQDISVLLGVTPATVDKHLRLAREALSAQTTAQALLKASLLNQIFMYRG